MLLFGGCLKESSVSPWVIEAESFNQGNAKMTVSGRTASWAAGDEVKINTTTATVALGSGTAYLSGEVKEANVYRAIYPASIAQSTALTEDEVTVNLPSTYTYREDANGVQLLDLPMAAAAKEFPLRFKHLTAGLVVNVTNNADLSNSNNSDKKYYVTKIIVSSNKYSLSGQRSFDITTADIGERESQTKDTIITLSFTGLTVGIGHGQSKQFMVPVAPVGGYNKYTITVLGYYLKGSNDLHKDLGATLQQRTGGALGRNKLAYAPISITDTSTVTIDELRIEGDYVYVSTVNGMERVIDSLRNRTSWRTKNIILEDDIELQVTTNGTTPITNFAGTLDGGGHTLSGLKFQSSIISSKVHMGLFTNPSGDVTIKNITLKYTTNTSDFPSTSSNSTIYVGPLCAYSDHNITIDNVTISKNITYQAANKTANTENGAKYYYGGMVGYLNGNISITNCNSDYNGKRTIVGFKYTYSGRNLYLYIGQLIGYLTDNHSANVTNTSISRAGLQGVNYTTLYAGKYIGAKGSSATWTFTNSTSVSGIYDNSGTNILSSLDH